MEDRVRAYVDSLFRNVLKTQQVEELIEEICSNLNEKIIDLINSGKSENEAFIESVATLGDTSELLSDITDYSYYSDYSASTSQTEDNNILDIKNHAAGNAFATMLILLGVISVAVAYLLSKNIIISAIVLFIFLIPAVGIYIYVGEIESKKKWSVNENSEEISNDEDKNKRKKRMGKAVSSAIWMFATCTFFILGFEYGKFHYAWIVFIAASGIEHLIKGWFDYK